jgi:type II secretion system protein H
MKNVPKSQLGYTLAELVIVVTILGIVAAIAVPTTSSSSDKSLALAASEFAAAMRFARSESIRTGEPHGFRQQDTAKRIRVFRLDQATSPATLIYDVYHPVDKQLYDVNITGESLFFADSVNRTAVYRGTCNKPENVYFDGSGAPWCANPDTVLLSRFEVDLVLGAARRTVILDDVTGRVTVQ